MLGSFGLAIAASAIFTTPCDALAARSTAQMTIATAALVPAGPFVPPGSDGRGAPFPPLVAGRGGPPAGRGGQAGRGVAEPTLPAHCKVTMVLRPTVESSINVELWMPVENWNGKFLAVGNGLFAGAIQGYGDMQRALSLGYATAGTDTGHSGANGYDATFALGHPEKVVDFAYRAVHEMTVKSKELINAFYDQAARYAYFKGCSTGGRQALMAAQRYPLDFDGIIAGALANRFIHMGTAAFARSVNVARHPEQELSAAKTQMVNAAVMQKCDTLHEGFLNDPRQCAFDFATLLCYGAESDSCLTRPQLQAVQEYYSGVKNSKGELIFSGQAIGNPVPPSRSTAPTYVDPVVAILAFQNPDYDWKTFDLDRDMPVIDQKVGFVDAVDPDLTAFKAHGGKLFLYAGWSDTTITPQNTVFYYESVLNKMGKNQGDWVRLFMVPGMAHCRGGLGTDIFDSIGTLEAWREKGVAPAQLTAANAQASMTRPLCPYPQYAKYKGAGNVKDAANWACAAAPQK
jgi:feruloyl esterase